MIAWINDYLLYLKKQQVIRLLDDSRIATVGRIQSWLENPESRYPVSCTNLSVEDTMEGENGIEYSWAYASKALRFGAGVAFDLSKLRGAGVDNGKGLVSSGAASFASLYSKFNEVLRRGGTYRNGAIVLYLNLDHPDFEDFVNTDLGEWVKKAVYIGTDPTQPDYVYNYPERLDLLLRKVQAGTVWLAKKTWYNPKTKLTQFSPVDSADVFKHRMFSQVCTEILFFSNSTCLLAHHNLGMCKPEELPVSMARGMEALCKLHAITGIERSGYYKSPKEDRQVGYGVIGLANFLAQNGITYKDFTDTLYDYVTGVYKDSKTVYNAVTLETVIHLYNGFQEAAKVARKYKMQRAFTVAPTATSSYKHKDLRGYTATPEISPPICHPLTKKSSRDSSVSGVVEYQYPPDVETAQEVGWDTYYKLAKAWQLLMASTGLAHAISMNVWNQCKMDAEWFDDWLTSPLVTTYYRMLVEQNAVDKSSIYSLDTAEMASTEEDDSNFFMPLDEDENPVDGFCPLNPNPDDFCSSCAESL